MRIVTDMVKYTTAEMPKWHPISISGYHIREAGSTAAQELAFTLANGFSYVEALSLLDKTSMSLGSASVSSLTAIAISLKKSVNSEQRDGFGHVG